jgi:hypothetical protein
MSIATLPIAVIHMCFYYAGSLDAMIKRMGIFIGCGYGSHMGIAVETLS